MPRQVSVVVPDALAALLDRRAADEGTSVDHVVRRILALRGLLVSHEGVSSVALTLVPPASRRTFDRADDGKTRGSFDAREPS